MLKPNWQKIIVSFALVVPLLTACNAGDGAAQIPTAPAAATVEETVPENPAETLAATSAPPSMAEDIYQGTDPTGQVVTFWHPFTGDQEAGLTELVQTFNQTNEWNISVAAEYQGSENDLFDKMLTFMDTPDAPDLIVAKPHQSSTYHMGSSLTDINEMVYDTKWGLNQAEIEDFIPGLFNQDVFPNYDDIRLGFPIQGLMRLSYYNQDWLRELGQESPPQTPEDFKEAACAAALQPYSGATAEGSIGYSINIDATLFASWTFAFGGQIFDHDRDQFTFDSPEAVAAMQFIQDLVNEGCANLITERNGDQIEFSQGTAIFTIGSSVDIPFYKSGVTAGADHDWSVTPVAHTTSSPVQHISAVSASIPKTSPESQLAAWLFLKFITSPEIQAEWARISNHLPVRSSAGASLGETFAANPAYAAAFELLPSGITEPPAAGYASVREMVAEAMYAISLGADVVDTLGTLNADANAFLSEQLSLIPEPPDPWADIDPSGQTVIFWHQQPPARHAALDELIWKFNSTNKWGISVVAAYQESVADRLQNVINTAEAPNLVETFQSQTADIQHSGAFSDMTALVESIKWGLSPQDQDDFYPGIYAQDIYPTFGGARLGFPPHRAMIVMYYNADWLAELRAAGVIDFDGPPQNPRQFSAAACAAAAHPFSRSLAESSMGYQLNVDTGNFASWTFAFGGDVFDYENTQYSYNHQSAIDAMAFLQGLFDQGCAGFITERFGDQTAFSQGSLLFTVGSTAGLSFYQSAIDEGADFNWAAAALPHTTETPVQNVYGASLSIVKGTPESELAAWSFIKYFTSPEVQAQWVQTTEYLPVRSSAAGGLVEFLAARPAYAAAFEMLPFATSEPALPGYRYVSGMVEEAMVAIVQGEDVQETLDQLNADANLNLAEQLDQ